MHARNAYSDDHGKSWRVGAAIGPDTDESHNVELADGSIVQNMRPAKGGARLIARSTELRSPEATIVQSLPSGEMRQIQPPGASTPTA